MDCVDIGVDGRRRIVEGRASRFGQIWRIGFADPRDTLSIEHGSLNGGDCMIGIITLWTILVLGAGGDDALSRLSDEFDDASSLNDWGRIHAVEGWNADQMQVLDVNTTQPSRLVMQPFTSTWYADYRGELTFKLVSGDFALTTEVHVTAADGGYLPQSSFSLAGLMIRTPRSITSPREWTPGGENYIFLSGGYGYEFAPCLPGAGPHLEVKTTTNSVSTLCISPVSSTTITIQLARIGEALICLAREPDGPWLLVNRYERPDFPSELQAGLVTYTDWPKVETYTPLFHNSTVLQPGLRPDPSTNPFIPFLPDLLAGFEYVRFASVSVPPDLAGVDLVNEATLEQLLTFLGDHVNQPSKPPLVGDLDDDGDVDGADLGLLLAGWGSDNPLTDLNDDGTTDGADLGLLLSSWT
jgi:hypothetical protein